MFIFIQIKYSYTSNERETGEKEIFVWDEKKQKEQMIDIIKVPVMESNQK